MTLDSARVLFDTIALELSLPSTWRLEFDNAKQRFGCCRYNVRTITLSAPIVLLNTEKEVGATIRHEIAHALVGPGHGHDSVWQAMARKCGDDGMRCYDPNVVAVPPAPWMAQCPTCGLKFERHREPKPGRRVWCGVCFRGRKVVPEAALAFTRTANTVTTSSAKPTKVDPLTLAKIRALRSQGRGYVAIDALFGIHGKRGWWSWKILKENGGG